MTRERHVKIVANLDTYAHRKENFERWQNDVNTIVNIDRSISVG